MGGFRKHARKYRNDARTFLWHTPGILGEAHKLHEGNEVSISPFALLSAPIFFQPAAYDEIGEDAITSDNRVITSGNRSIRCDNRPVGRGRGKGTGFWYDSWP